MVFYFVSVFHRVGVIFNKENKRLPVLYWDTLKRELKNAAPGFAGYKSEK